MAKRKINKSQAIRDYVKKNRKATAKQIVEGLAALKISVSEGLVANVKSKSGLTKRRKKKKATTTSTKKRGRGKASSNGQLDFDALVDAKKLIVKSGSVENAIAMLKAVDKLDTLG